ncbi:MAG TPA: universal stress protein [Azospirillum sp.]
MTYKNLLVHLDDGERANARLDIALHLAKDFDAKLVGLFAKSEQSGPSLVARRASEHLTQAGNAVRAVFEEKAKAAGVDAKWWQLSHGEYAHVVGETAICARYSDLIVLGQHEPEDARVPQELIEEVVLNCGRPVLVIPYIRTTPHVGERVVVAWNASREAARAINDALPLMRRAKSVLVLALHPPRPEIDIGGVPPVDIIEHLADHGVTAQIDRMSVESILPMDAVLSRVSDEDADLLVMGGFGGYGSHPFPWLNRGSNTRHILRQMTVPVLLSH